MPDRSCRPGLPAYLLLREIEPVGSEVGEHAAWALIDPARYGPELHVLGKRSVGGLTRVSCRTQPAATPLTPCAWASTAAEFQTLVILGTQLEIRT